MKWNKLLSLERQVRKGEEPSDFSNYPISELEKDYQSIISSSAFRRLQDKTQVFPLDKSDFVRTRLTHSIEVSTIARQLGIMVTNNSTGYLREEFKDNQELKEQIPIILSCAGLLHDIGILLLDILERLLLVTGLVQNLRRILLCIKAQRYKRF